MEMSEEMFNAKARNWAALVTKRADDLCEIRKNEDDVFIQLLTGKIFEDAAEQIALEIQSGFYDEMLMPRGV